MHVGAYQLALEGVTPMPNGSLGVIQRGSLDVLAALIALTLGLSLVAVLLVVAFPLIALASSGWRLKALVQPPSGGGPSRNGVGSIISVAAALMFLALGNHASAQGTATRGIIHRGGASRTATFPVQKPLSILPPATSKRKPITKRQH